MQFIFLAFRTPPPTTSQEDIRVVLNGAYAPLFFSLFQISGILTLIFLHQSGTIKFLVLFLGIPSLQPGQSMLFPFLGPV